MKPETNDPTIRETKIELEKDEVELEELPQEVVERIRGGRLSFWQGGDSSAS